MASLTNSEAQALLYEWRNFWARPKQIPPITNWFICLYLAGRGYGKTKLSSEWIRWKVETGQARRIALVARTAADVRDVLVRGDSGILACAPPNDRPKYEPSKRLLTWANGAIAHCYSADEPDLLRGPQHDTAACDEVATWSKPEAWSNLLLGLRLGNRPQLLATTTPKPTKLIRELVSKYEQGDKSIELVKGSTYENRVNLAASFFDSVVSAYEGTRIGRQEIEGELLLDVVGALWKYDWIAENRVDKTPELQRIVVAIDPATTANPDSDYTGITVAGKGNDAEYYVLASEQVKLSPQGWAKRALDLFDQYEADRIIAERNNGGDMVAQTIRTLRSTAPLKTIHASRGKTVRAEPAVALYEQNKVHHCGIFNELENQQTTFPVACENDDLVDSLVYALSELSGRKTITFA